MRTDVLLQLLAAAARGAAPPAALVSGLELAIEPVAGRVWVVRGAGANLALCVADDALVLSDTSFAAVGPALHRALAAFSPRPLRWAVNTHWHPDHTDGNAALPPGVAVVSTAATRARLAAGAPSLLGHAVAPAPERALPTVTFADTLRLPVKGEAIELVAVPGGHTEGDALVHFRGSGVVHMGDCFVTYGFPFVDRACGGSLDGYVAVLERAGRELPPEVRIIPGHGPVSARGDLLRLADALRACTERVRAAAARGWSPEEIAARGVLDAYRHLARGIVGVREFVALALDGAR